MVKNKVNKNIYLKRFKNKPEDVRGPFFRDQTAIIHSFPFRRLKRKTQVFFAPDNDHICTRIEHSFHVFTNTETICKGLITKGWKLDIEMAQAIALGHDIGHAPFGHAGEKHLDEIMKKEKGISYNFYHEINSLRVCDHIAEKGEGLKLTYGVRDGIVKHCGENLSKDQFLKPDWKIRKLEDIKKLEYYPSSFEGCIVRLADKISSLGRDVEDSVRLEIIEPESIPNDILEYLNIEKDRVRDDFNRAFLTKVIYDIIDTSHEKELIGMSNSCFKKVNQINTFSEENIYATEKIKNYKIYVSVILDNIYNSLSKILEKYNYNFTKYSDCFIKSYKSFGHWLETYYDFYKGEKTEESQILIDYISGMSDNFAINFHKDISIPKTVFK